MPAEVGKIARMVLGERPAREPAEIVIWGASSLLAVLLGVGCAFMLWSQLHETARVGLLMASVGAVGAGLALIGVSSSNARIRVMLFLFAAALELAFFTGGTAFAHIVH